MGKLDSVFFIFGKNISIKCNDKLVSSILADELELYPSGDEMKIDLVLDFVQEIDNQGILSSNPSIHHLTNDGFIFNMGAVIGRYFFVKRKPVRMTGSWDVCLFKK